MKNPETVRPIRGYQGSFKYEDESTLNLPLPHQKSKLTIQKDARVVQFLKQECKRSGAGAPTLEEVFRGLLSVHNRQLTAFADALKMEVDDEA
jgi:hypothetical protein